MSVIADLKAPGITYDETFVNTRISGEVQPVKRT
jgi:hypothetical protein